MIGTFISVWFKNRETSVAYSFDTCFSYLSNAICNFVMPIIFNHFRSLTFCFGTVFEMALIGLLFSLVVCYIDGKSKETEEVNSDGKEAEKFSLKMIKDVPLSFWLLAVAIATVMESFLLQDIISSSMYQDIFGFSDQEAGFFISIPSMFLGLLCLISGTIVYNIGRKPLVRKCP